MSKQSFNEFNENIHNAKSRFIKDLERLLVDASLKFEARGKLNATSYPKVGKTGRLRNSIAGIAKRKGKKNLLILKAGGTVKGKPVEYAKYIEFGTRFIKPRLFLDRAVRTESKLLVNKLSDLLHVTMGAD